MTMKWVFENGFQLALKAPFRVGLVVTSAMAPVVLRML